MSNNYVTVQEKFLELVKVTKCTLKEKMPIREIKKGKPKNRLLKETSRLENGDIIYVYNGDFVDMYEYGE